MPQMAPLNWLTLMIFFISILLIMNSINFYSFMYSTKISHMNKSMIKINWKW